MDSDQSMLSKLMNSLVPQEDLELSEKDEGEEKQEIQQDEGMVKEEDKEGLGKD